MIVQGAGSVQLRTSLRGTHRVLGGASDETYSFVSIESYW